MSAGNGREWPETKDDSLATARKRGLMGPEDKANLDALVAAPAPPTGTAWAALDFTLLPNWADYGAGYPTFAWKRDADGFIHLKGRIKKSAALGALPETISNLHIACKPTTIRTFAVACASGGYTEIQIDTTGVLALTAGGSATWLSLDDIPPYDPNT